MAAHSAAVDARAVRLAVLGIVLLALLPSVGTLDAPWIAEDASILARVHADGPWADWTRSQYGLHLVRFWRPLVSTSWALQEAATGIAPVPLRLFNLGLHALAAVLVFGCARRLGAGLPGALVAGAWIALFPEQGGTSTWLAGRTDLVCAVPLLASVYAALGRAPVLGAPCAFLACAAKEFGFLAPAWIALFARARGDGWRGSLRRAAPAAAAVALAFAWRRAALGTFAGGYPLELSGPWSSLHGLLASTWSYNWASLFLLPPLLAALFTPRRRAIGAAMAAWGLALVPLFPLLADGWLEPENRRLFYVAECAFALAAGLLCKLLGGERTRARFAALAILYLAWRAALAWTDTHDWARAAHAGEQEVARARAALAGAAPGPAPVLFASFPASTAGAYCLGFGVAARFRAPFPAAPRPVWPWRLAGVPRAERERAPLAAPRADGSIWPLDDRRSVAGLELRPADGGTLAEIHLDERVFVAGADLSPRFVLAGPAGARLEAVLASEIGYEPFALGNMAADGTAAFSLRELLSSSNGTFSGGGVLQQAADLGAGRACLELRALGEDGLPLAATRWIEVVWPRELLALSLGR